MKTILRYADRMYPEMLLAAWRSVSADSVNLAVSLANRSGTHLSKIKNPRIVVMHLSGAVVAEEIVELRQASGT